MTSPSPARSLPPFMHRISALALLFGAALVLYTVVLAPAIDRAAYDAAELMRAKERLGQLQALAVSVDRFNQVAQRAQALESVRGLFIEAPSPVAASARLQEQLKELADSSGARVTSLLALPLVDEKDHRRVTLRLLLTADTPALQAVLHGIENAEVALVVEKLYVRARARSVEAIRDLDVEIEVAGFLAKSAADTQ